MILIFDCETDGLYNEATKMWCLVAKILETGETFSWFPDVAAKPGQLPYIFREADKIIGHNIIDFDIPVLDKLGVVDKDELLPKAVDTLVMSTVLNPDRVKPPGISHRSGPHSLEAWGVRVGMGKGEHSDWTQFSEEMLHYCERDVLVNEKTYLALLEEMEK